MCVCVSRPAEIIDNIATHLATDGNESITWNKEFMLTRMFQTGIQCFEL